MFLRSDGQPVACRKSDGHCSIPPTLCFWMPGVMVKLFLFVALLQHAAQGVQEFLTSTFLQELSTLCFSEVMVKLLPAKNLMDTAAFRQHFFFDARCDGQAVSCSSNATLHPRRQEFLTSKFLQEFPHRVFSEVMVKLLPAKI